MSVMSIEFDPDHEIHVEYVPTCATCGQPVHLNGTGYDERWVHS